MRHSSASSRGLAPCDWIFLAIRLNRVVSFSVSLDISWLISWAQSGRPGCAASTAIANAKWQPSRTNIEPPEKGECNRTAARQNCGSRGFERGIGQTPSPFSGTTAEVQPAPAATTPKELAGRCQIYAFEGGRLSLGYALDREILH